MQTHTTPFEGVEESVEEKFSPVYTISRDPITPEEQDEIKNTQDKYEVVLKCAQFRIQSGGNRINGEGNTWVKATELYKELTGNPIAKSTLRQIYDPGRYGEVLLLKHGHQDILDKLRSMERTSPGKGKSVQNSVQTSTRDVTMPVSIPANKFELISIIGSWKYGFSYKPQNGGTIVIEGVDR